MFSMFKLSLALAFAASFASAQTITEISGNLVSGGSVTIDWSASSTAASTFSVYIIHDTFNTNFGLANNILTSQNSLTAELPVLPPGDGYTIELVAIDDVNTVYSTSKEFSVGAMSATMSTTISGHSAVPATPTAAGASSTPSQVLISTKPIPSFTPTSGSDTADSTSDSASASPSSTAPSSSAPSATGSSGAAPLGGNVSGALLFGALCVVAGAYVL